MTTSFFFLLLVSLNTAFAVAVIRHLRARHRPAAPAVVPGWAAPGFDGRNPAATSTLITIELLNPLRLAQQRQGLVARVAGVVAPKHIKRIVHDTVARQIRAQLADEGAHADVRIVTLPASSRRLPEAEEPTPERVETPRPGQHEARRPDSRSSGGSRNACRKRHHGRSGSTARGTGRPNTESALDEAFLIVPEHATAVLDPANEAPLSATGGRPRSR